MNTDRANSVDLLAIASNETMLKKAGANEWAGPCPSCGGKDRFSVRLMQDGRFVWVCRMCSDGKYHDAIDYMKHYHGHDFKTAVQALTGETTTPVPIKRNVRKIAPQPTKRRAWYKQTPDWYNAKFSQFNDAWKAYKTLTDQQIETHRLRFGKLPASKCQHDRLILPVFADGQLVNLRGRSLGCDCGKWLASGGWTLDELPLYNWQALHDRALVLIVESPVDAIQATGVGAWNLVKGHIRERHDVLAQMSESAMGGLPPIVAVATYSTSYWRPAWTELIKDNYTIVMFDNDLAGNGGARARSKLLRERGNKPIPKARGVKLVNDLRDAGTTARLFDWGRMPAKCDIGAVL